MCKLLKKKVCKMCETEQNNPVAAVNMLSLKVVAEPSVEIRAIFVCREEASLSPWHS